MQWYRVLHLDYSVAVGENYNHGMMGEIDRVRRLTVIENVNNACTKKTVIMYSVYMGAQLS